MKYRAESYLSPHDLGKKGYFERLLERKMKFITEKSENPK